MPWRKSHHHLRHHGFMFILSVRLWRRPIRVPMVGFLCWDDMLMNVFLLWFGFLPFFFFFFFFSSLYFVSVVMAGWHWMNCVFFDRICRSSHPHRNWWLRIFMQMNGDLNISFEVIAHSSCFPLLGCCHILLCILSIVTDESIEFQVNRVDTCFRVVGVISDPSFFLLLSDFKFFKQKDRDSF